MSNSALAARRSAAIALGVGVSSPLFATRARNAELWDAEERRYIDFASGIAVLNTGHGHPRVVAAAKLGYAGFPAQAIEHDPDLVFRRVVLPGRPADVLDDLLGRAIGARGFLSHLHSYVVTMRQKPSVPQDP